MDSSHLDTRGSISQVIEQLPPAKIGKAGILVFGGIYLNVLMDQFFYLCLLSCPKDKKDLFLWSI